MKADQKVSPITPSALVDEVMAAPLKVNIASRMFYDLTAMNRVETSERANQAIVSRLSLLWGFEDRGGKL